MKKIILLLSCTFLLCTSVAFAADDDGDGIDSAIETVNGTDRNDADTDNDMLLDGQEDLNQNGIVDAGETNPRDADTDNDGLKDGEEDMDQNGFISPWETNPLDSDTDNDFLNDGLEKGRNLGIPGGTSDGGVTAVTYSGTTAGWIGDAEPTTQTDPADDDTDGDGTLDGIEDADRDGSMDTFESDPLDADTDDDGISDGEELTFSLNKLNKDTDNDSLNDGLEKGRTSGIMAGTSVNGIAYRGTDISWTPDTDPATLTDPQVNDTDNDGISDGIEDINRNGHVDATETKPTDADSDDDGLKDGEEDLNSNRIVDASETDPMDSDSDNDGLTDGQERGKGSPVPGGTSSGSYVLNRVSYTGTAAGWIPDSQTSSVTNPMDDDTDNDGLSDGTEDANRDGIKDATETDPNNADTDADGISDSTEGLAIDTDSDGLINALDSDDDEDGIPTLTEGSTINTDGDAFPDYLDTDSDNDGIPDWREGSSDSPLDTDAIPNYLDTDSDGDGIPDSVEGYLDSPLDADALPNYLDLDSDGDGKTDQAEGGTLDTDTDGRLNFLDDDSDNDGFREPVDNCYLMYNPSQQNTDGDMLGDVCDPDDDNDGVPDENDCDPLDPSIYPGAIDIPDDGIDQDCNGTDAVTCYADNDMDGYGNTFGYTVIAYDGTCDIAQKESTSHNDCNDNDAVYHPGAAENCNNPDYNCDGITYEGTSATLEVINCDSYTAPDGQVYTTSGIKTAVIPNAAGCDSTITIDLTITEGTESSITVKECNSYTAPDGQVYTTSGIKTAVIPNIAGCDSTITINLSITQSTESSITITECNSYTAPDGQVYTTSGIKTAVIPNAEGCDSTITIDLEIMQNESSTISDTVCGSYEWNGTTYYTSGEYTFNTTSAAGCDSTAHLNLTVNPIPETPSVSSVGTMLYSNSPNGNQWYNQDGLVEGATGNEFSGSAGNSYYVIVTLNYCNSAQSNTVNLIETGLNVENRVKKYEIFPNPVSSILNIKTNGGEFISIEIINSSGAVIYSDRFMDETAINTLEFSSGIYLIKLYNGNHTEFVKMMKE